jgi:hypothetical protein
MVFHLAVHRLDLGVDLPHQVRVLQGHGCGVSE